MVHPNLQVLQVCRGLGYEEQGTWLTLGDGKLGRRAFWAGVGMGEGALSSGVCMLRRGALCCGRRGSGEGA